MTNFEQTLGVSVIIPLFNKGMTLSRAIDSVLAQKGGAFEIIVVDDGSTDDFKKIVDAYCKEITFIHQENSGPSAARNRGVREAKYSLLAFLDADDEFLPGCLHEHLKCRAIYRDTKISLASYNKLSGKHQLTEEILQLRRPDLVRKSGMSMIEEFSYDYVINMPSGSICVDRLLFDAIGGFDVRLRCWEITDFMLRALLYARKFVILESVLVSIHEDTDNSQFLRTNVNTEYLVVFAHKIVDAMSCLPVKERNRFSNKLYGVLYALFHRGELEEFKRLACRVCALIPGEKGARKLCIMSLFPVWLLKIALIVRKLLG